jgi:hypothetical protein
VSGKNSILTTAQTDKFFWPEARNWERGQLPDLTYRGLDDGDPLGEACGLD